MSVRSGVDGARGQATGGGAAAAERVLKRNRPCTRALPRESRAWPGPPILIRRGGHKPWGSYQACSRHVVNAARAREASSAVASE
jgi:hypothetical protein